jgi:hypothetical protein
VVARMLASLDLSAVVSGALAAFIAGFLTRLALRMLTRDGLREGWDALQSMLETFWINVRLHAEGRQRLDSNRFDRIVLFAATRVLRLRIGPVPGSRLHGVLDCLGFFIPKSVREPFWRDLLDDRDEMVRQGRSPLLIGWLSRARS